MNMKKRTAVLAVFLTAFLVAAKPSAAATNIYLQIPGIPGEATATNYKDDIQLLSYSQSVMAPATVGSGIGGITAGRATCGQITFIKHVDKASYLLVQAVMTGKRIPDGYISFVDTQGNGGVPRVDYLVTLKEFIFTSVQQSDSSPAELTENVSLVASKFDIEYVPFNSRGVAGAAEKLSVDCTASIVN